MNGDRISGCHFNLKYRNVMAKELFIDIETYSETDIAECGAYKYLEDPSMEILILSYALDNGPVKVVDLLSGEDYPEEFTEAFYDEGTLIWAHNAVFERKAFERSGMKTDLKRWRCSSVKASYCGLPMSLDKVSKALDLTDKKLDTGKMLIKYFSCPCKPTKINGGRTRNYPEHAPEKWEKYKEYNKYDVLAEREIVRMLEKYEIPEMEQMMYVMDQEINDRGILIDLVMAENAIYIDADYKDKLIDRIKSLTGIDNPNSTAQMKAWLEKKTGKKVPSLNKDVMPELLESAEGDVLEVLSLRNRLAKTSIKKYQAMLNCASATDHRARGLFQFYGAGRTGRWAGRLIQLQNLPQNHINDLELARSIVAEGEDADLMEMLYDNVPSVLSQLIRTAFIAPEGKTFAVADFSAIEARVISWYACEEWRLEVFRTHGKIYEASAAMMFGVPIEMVKKGSDLRAKGKVAELALGYEGSLGALKRMGGERMGLSDSEMTAIVKKWRASNPNIVALWRDVEACAKKAVKLQGRTFKDRTGRLEFFCDGFALTIKLPSNRQLFYHRPRICNGPKGEGLHYYGVNQETKQWGLIDTYGGKLTENIVQAFARDLLAYAMYKLTRYGFDIVMHVHDENIAEVPAGDADVMLEQMCEIMGEEVPWAEGLPLRADGYTTPFYKKD